MRRSRMCRGVWVVQAGKLGLPRGCGPLSWGRVVSLGTSPYLLRRRWNGELDGIRRPGIISSGRTGFQRHRTMQFFGRPTLTLILIGWHFLLAASGHGLHRLTSGEDRCADPVTTSCGCSHPDAATCRSDSGLGTSREGPFAAELGRASRRHDSHTCAICQWLTQHKSLPPAALTVVTARPLVELAQRAFLSPHRSCVCPYASRAPPGISSLT